MAKKIIDTNTLTAIADSIREKGSTSSPIAVSDFADAIAALPSGGGMNKQANCTSAGVAVTSLTSTGLKLTVATTGTYKISWAAWRSSSSGTMSTRLYVNGVAKDSDRTTWTRTYGQQITITGFDLTAGQEVEIYARSSSTSRYCTVANLVIEQTA